MIRLNNRLAMFAAAGLAFGLGSHALAQPSVLTKPVVSAAASGQSKIDRYAKVLTLDQAQTEAAKSLYETYQKETQSLGKKMRAAMKDAQDDMNDGDRASFEKKIQQSMAEQTASTKKLTDELLSDLKALLTPAQADRWPSFERYRRREHYLNSMMGMGGMGVAGSSVDLVPLIDKLGIPTDLKPKVDEQLAMYELDIDRPLQERQHNLDDEQKTMGAVQRFDGDTFSKKLDRDRKVDMAIREVNTKYVRQIAAILPTDLAAKLNDAYQLKAYRTIYKDSSIARKLAAAQQVKDLSADQRTQLQAMIDKYKRDARAANDRWADAQQRAETAGRPTGGGMLVFGPGGPNGGGEKIDPDFAAARSARRDLDSSAREQLDKLLTPEQSASIPEPATMRGGVRSVAVLGDHTGENMVVVDDIDMPDDFDPAESGGGGATMIIRTVQVGGPGDPHDTTQGAPATPPAEPPKPAQKP